MADQSKFNVLAMAEEYAKSEGKEVADLFAKPQPKKDQYVAPDIPAGAEEQPTVADTEDDDVIPVKMVKFLRLLTILMDYLMN